MKHKTDFRWVSSIVAISITMSMTFSLVSSEILGGAGYTVAFILLFIFIFIGIIFDAIGVAVTSATETPFHSMASHKENGAMEAIRLLRRAERVSSICNDVIGDICGIVSGATAAAIAGKIVRDLGFSGTVIQILTTGLVAGLTIGGKAAGKASAINNSTIIVLTTGKVIAFFRSIFCKK